MVRGATTKSAYGLSPLISKQFASLQCKASSCQYQVGKSEAGEQLRSVFGQPAVSGFPMAEQVFNDVEGMFDLCPHAWLDDFELLAQAPQACVG